MIWPGLFRFLSQLSFLPLNKWLDGNWCEAGRGAQLRALLLDQLLDRDRLRLVLASLILEWRIQVDNPSK